MCPECLRKLRWGLGFDFAKRYRKLGRLYRKLGWDKEAEFVERPGAVVPIKTAKPSHRAPHEEEVPQ
jgi:hypothetical protein